MLRLPLRAIHPFADGPRAASLAYVQTAFNAPPFSVTEVMDVIGLPWAYDVTLNDGFYLTLLAYVLLRAATRWTSARLAATRRSEDEDVR